MLHIILKLIKYIIKFPLRYIPTRKYKNIKLMYKLYAMAQRKQLHKYTKTMMVDVIYVEIAMYAMFLSGIVWIAIEPYKYIAIILAYYITNVTLVSLQYITYMITWKRYEQDAEAIKAEVTHIKRLGKRYKKMYH